MNNISSDLNKCPKGMAYLYSKFEQQYIFWIIYFELVAINTFKYQQIQFYSFISKDCQILL